MVLFYFKNIYVLLFALELLSSEITLGPFNNRKYTDFTLLVVYA